MTVDASHIGPPEKLSVEHDVCGTFRKGADWLKIGVAWLHRDGKCFDVAREATLINGRVVVRLNTPKTKRDEDVGA